MSGYGVLKNAKVRSLCCAMDEGDKDGMDYLYREIGKKILSDPQYFSVREGTGVKMATITIVVNEVSGGMVSE